MTIIRFGLFREPSGTQETLTKHFGFTEEELAFIINYDIKYRMGKELQAG